MSSLDYKQAPSLRQTAFYLTIFFFSFLYLNYIYQEKHLHYIAVRSMGKPVRHRVNSTGGGERKSNAKA